MPRRFSDAWIPARDGLRLHLRSSAAGGAPPLLLVHGAFGHGQVMDFLAEALPPELPIHCLDLPGHGESEWGADEDRYAFTRLVDDIDAAVDWLGAPPILCGHSIGSALTMQYASARAGKLAGVVLMEIDPFPPKQQADHLNDVGGREVRVFDTFDDVVRQTRRTAPEAAAAVHEHLARTAYRESSGGFKQKFDQAFLRSIRTWDLRAGLPDIQVPALVLRGAASTVMSPEGYDDLLRSLPEAQGQLIAGATHQLHLDEPEAVGAAITAFIAARTW